MYCSTTNRTRKRKRSIACTQAAPCPVGQDNTPVLTSTVTQNYNSTQHESGYNIPRGGGTTTTVLLL